MEINERRTLVRQAAYRLFGALFLYPLDSRLGIIGQGANWLSNQIDEAELTSVFGDADLAAKLLAAVGPFKGDLEALQADWVGLFGASRSGGCKPYEGANRSDKDAQALIAELDRMCAQVGLALKVNELPDHATVQFEFMSHLCARLLAILDGKPDVSAQVLTYQRGFLKRHLAHWFPRFETCVANHDNAFYALVTHVAANFIEKDVDYLDEQLEGSPLPVDAAGARRAQA